LWWRKWNECQDEEKKKKIEKIGKLHTKFNGLTILVYSWTIDLLSNLVWFLVLLFTFNKPRIKFRLGDGRAFEKGTLFCDISFAPKGWHNPIRMVGRFVADSAILLIRPILAMGLLAVLLPATFSTMFVDFMQWAPIQKDLFSFEFFAGLYDCFVKVAWHDLIIGGFAENNILLVLFIVVFAIFLSDGFWDVLRNYKDFYWIPMTIVCTIIFNVIFGLINPVEYIIVSQNINVVGIAILFVLLFKEIAFMIRWCTQSIIKLVIEKVVKV
jgi:hypothetical protein